MKILKSVSVWFVGKSFYKSPLGLLVCVLALYLFYPTLTDVPDLLKIIKIPYYAVYGLTALVLDVTPMLCILSFNFGGFSGLVSIEDKCRLIYPELPSKLLLANPELCATIVHSFIKRRVLLVCIILLVGVVYYKAVTFETSSSIRIIKPDVDIVKPDLELDEVKDLTDIITTFEDVGDFENEKLQKYLGTKSKGRILEILDEAQYMLDNVIFFYDTTSIKVLEQCFKDAHIIRGPRSTAMQKSKEYMFRELCRWLRELLDVLILAIE
jgi:hypothetical protein